GGRGPGGVPEGVCGPRRAGGPGAVRVVALRDRGSRVDRPPPPPPAPRAGGADRRRRRRDDPRPPGRGGGRRAAGRAGARGRGRSRPRRDAPPPRRHRPRPGRAYAGGGRTLDAGFAAAAVLLVFAYAAFLALMPVQRQRPALGAKTGVRTLAAVLRTLR